VSRTHPLFCGAWATVLDFLTHFGTALNKLGANSASVPLLSRRSVQNRGWIRRRRPLHRLSYEKELLLSLALESADQPKVRWGQFFVPIATGSVVPTQKLPDYEFPDHHIQEAAESCPMRPGSYHH
jgi:hypothetical protein